MNHPDKYQFEQLKQSIIKVKKQSKKQMTQKKDKFKPENDEPTFELLMEKFQFHNDAVQHHAHLAKFIGEKIRLDFPEEAKQTGYFTDQFFEENNKAKAEPGDTSPGGVSQTSESASERK